MGQTLREAVLAADVIPPGTYEDTDGEIWELSVPHRLCLAECDICAHRWGAVFPDVPDVVSDGWECPNCGAAAGRPYEKPDWE